MFHCFQLSKCRPHSDLLHEDVIKWERKMADNELKIINLQHKGLKTMFAPKDFTGVAAHEINNKLDKELKKLEDENKYLQMQVNYAVEQISRMELSVIVIDAVPDDTMTSQVLIRRRIS